MKQKMWSIVDSQCDYQDENFEFKYTEIYFRLICGNLNKP